MLCDTRSNKHFFYVADENEVFRIRSVERTDKKTLEELGSYKFMCVKKYNRNDCMLNEDGAVVIREHKTTTFNNIVEKRKDRVLVKETKSSGKNKTKKAEFDKDTQVDDTSKKVRFDFERTERKLPLGERSEEHTNNAFLDSDDEAETFKASLPELTSSFDFVEAENNEKVDLTKSIGTLFSNKSSHESPRLKAKSSITNETNEAKNQTENNNETHLHSFREEDSDISDSEQSSDNCQQMGKELNNPDDNLIGEMKKINSALPNLELNKKYKAKRLEEVQMEEYKNMNERKFIKQNAKDKPKMKHALKALMKTTAESTVKLPSSSDVKFIEADRKLKEKNKSSAANDRKSKDNEMAKNNEDGQAESDFKTLTVDTAKRPLKDREDKSRNNFQLEESSSDGDDVEMIYQSDKVKLENLNTSKDITENNEDEKHKKPSKSILKIQKGNSPKLSSSRHVTKDKLNSEKVVQPKKKFKMPEDLDLGENDEMWTSLRSSNIIPICKTDKTKPLDSSLTDKDPIERDIEVLDWECDVDESADLARIQQRLRTSQNSTSSSPQLKGIAETSATKKTKHGVSRFDSTRKYLGTSVPRKEKKIIKQ